MGTQPVYTELLGVNGPGGQGNVAARIEQSVFDGTTGRGDRSGRRTHIIQILRDARAPVTVTQVAQEVGVHVNTARFHLEALVDAGLATRSAQSRDTPGRPQMGYLGTLPNQTHERAHSYRLLAQMLTTAVAQSGSGSARWMYQAGQDWGRRMTASAGPSAAAEESEIVERLVERLDALWFAPELPDDQPGKLLLHNCPFIDSAKLSPGVVCQLHAGMINGTLAEMGSNQRLVRLCAEIDPHLCTGELGEARQMDQVELDVANLAPLDR
ncbi:MAG: helix-turn-helix domain-containing protein [Bifidobacteriaceae bacterium]|jgi:predicted ArsR family transcriptional regulator|nr:helix-turn-helix domain-containing protein [Bifidobacteriaceae bacterium]